MDGPKCWLTDGNKRPGMSSSSLASVNVDEDFPQCSQSAHPSSWNKSLSAFELSKTRRTHQHRLAGGAEAIYTSCTSLIGSFVATNSPLITLRASRSSDWAGDVPQRIGVWQWYSGCGAREQHSQPFSHPHIASCYHVLCSVSQSFGD